MVWARPWMLSGRISGRAIGSWANRYCAFYLVKDSIGRCGQRLPLCPSQGQPESAVDVEWLARAEIARIGQERRRIGKRGRVEQAARGIEALIEYVLNEAVDLQLLADLIGGVDAEHGIARNLRKCAVLVAERDLARRRDHVGPDLPPVGDAVVEADLQRVLRNAGDRRAVGDRNVAVRVGQRIERRRLHEGCEVHGVDKG